MTNINVNEIETIQDVLNAINNREFEVGYMARPKKIKADTVFDENKSVKWNREEVERINKMNSDNYNAHRAEVEAAEEFEKTTIIKVFSKEYGISIAKVERVFSYVWNESHSSGMYEVVQNLDSLMELISDLDSIN